MKRFIKYIILLVIYIYLPGISQDIFMKYDNYYFFIIISLLFTINLFFAFNFLKSLNKVYNFIQSVAVTSVGILSVVVGLKLNNYFVLVGLKHKDFFGIDAMILSIFSNAIFSILSWEIIYQLKKEKTAIK
jgi:hypothetical protein